MRKARRVIPRIALCAAIASTGVVFAASPAAAIPHDCTLTVSLNRVAGGMLGTGTVSCPRQEHYSIEIVVRREDGILGNKPVATNYKGYHTTRSSLSALEPCSDVQTTKKYHAHAYLYDTRFGYPIEVHDRKSASAQGHC